MEDDSIGKIALKIVLPVIGVLLILFSFVGFSVGDIGIAIFILVSGILIVVFSVGRKIFRGLIRLWEGSLFELEKSKEKRKRIRERAVKQAKKEIDDSEENKELDNRRKTHKRDTHKTIARKEEKNEPDDETPMIDKENADEFDSDSSKRETENNKEDASDKDRGILIVMWLLLGLVGGHRFYAGRVGSGFLYLFTAGLFVIGFIVDFFGIVSGNFKDEHGLPIKN